MHMEYYQSILRVLRQTGLLLIMLGGVAGCMSYDEFNNHQYSSIAQKNQLSASVTQSPCYGSLDSNCGDTQEEYLEALLKNLELYGLNKTSRNIPTEAAKVWMVLPKDRLGGVNWTKAAVEGIIKPRNFIDEVDPPHPAEQINSRDDLTDITVRETEHFQKLIVIQSKNHFMADVLFPHGMHTYWVGCNSCHPKPFATKIGGTNMTMKEIREGEFCGRCHGNVSFPLEPIDNCRRCHVLPKKFR